VRVDLLERGHQALACFAVEALDAEAKLLDCFDEIVPLGGQRRMLGFDLDQFFLGAQVHRTQTLALAAQALQGRFDFGEVGQGFAVLELGELGDALRLDFEHVVDFTGDVGEAALGGFEAFLGAGGFFARR